MRVGWGGQPEALGSTREEHCGRGATSGGAQGGPTCGSVPAGCPLCIQLGGTPPWAGRRGLPHLALWPQFPQQTGAEIPPESCVSQPLPPRAAVPQPGPDSPVSPARVPPAGLFTLLSLLSLSGQNGPHHTPKPACVGNPPAPALTTLIGAEGLCAGHSWALAGTGLRSRGHPCPWEASEGPCIHAGEALAVSER